MKSNVIYRSIALSLAALILLSTSGVALNFHFCGGHLASFAIWKEAPNCMELLAERNCIERGSSAAQNTSEKRECPIGCCDDTGIEMDADYDLVSSAAPQLKPANQWQDVITATTSNVLGSDLVYHHQQTGLTYRPPPDPCEDILARIQTWLI